jgi:hypothetical protein
MIAPTGHVSDGMVNHRYLAIPGRYCRGGCPQPPVTDKHGGSLWAATPTVTESGMHALDKDVSITDTMRFFAILRIP